MNGFKVGWDGRFIEIYDAFDLRLDRVVHSSISVRQECPARQFQVRSPWTERKLKLPTETPFSFLATRLSLNTWSLKTNKAQAVVV